MTDSTLNSNRLEPHSRHRDHLSPNPGLIAFLGLLLAPGALWAHPGHGLSDVAVSHWITSPDHLALLCGLGLLLWISSTRTSRRGLQRALRFTSLALWGGSALLLAWTS